MTNDSDDLISRQAAIDELKRISFPQWYVCGADVREISIINSNKAFESIMALPSAQSENIRCKDCNVYGICRFELGLGENGYCSQAQRRNENGNL